MRCCCCCCYEELLVSFCLNACFPILFGWNCLFENKFLEIGGVAQQLRVHVVLLEAQSLVVVPVLGAHSCLQPLGPVVPMTSFGFHWSTRGIPTWTPILENKFSSLSHCLLLFHIRNEQYYVWKKPKPQHTWVPGWWQLAIFYQVPGSHSFISSLPPSILASTESSPATRWPQQPVLSFRQESTLQPMKYSSCFSKYMHYLAYNP